jgi:hypothetical protein
MQRILSTALDVVVGIDAASIVLSVDGRLETAASTDPWAAALDGLQITVGSGPLLDAIEAGTCATPDLGADRRWPQLTASDASGTIGATFSHRLVVSGDDTGALTCYSRRADGFDAAAIHTGDILAAHAAVALERAFDRLTVEARTEAWQQALASRDVIGQAKGILMQQRNVDADQAFLDLRYASQRLNRKVRDIAEQIVTERRLPGS